MPRRMLITAGPTHEPIDAVRYLANRSSGQLGIALAEAAHAAGWQVTLLLGPTSLTPLSDVAVVRFQSTADLQALLDSHFPNCDVLIMAAAVADFRPAHIEAAKLPRSNAPLVLTLEPTPDLVALCAQHKRRDQLIVGFALEDPGQLEKRAQEKLKRKGLDAIIANPIDTPGSPTIAARLFSASGEVVTPFHGAKLTKRQFATWLINWIGEAVKALRA